MQITKGFKFQNRDFGSKTFEVTLTHSELGLSDPTSVEETRDVIAELAFQAEALCVIEEVKCGLVHSDQISERLRPWAPTSVESQNSKSSTTAPV